MSIEKIKGSIRGLFLLVLGTFLILYAGVSSYLYAVQTQIIFPGAENRPENIEAIYARYPDAMVGLRFDDITLWGWYLNKGRKKPIIIYYGGNAEDVSYRVLQFAPLVEYQSVFMNYRGYGESEGEPSEDLLYADALKIYDKVVDRYNAEKIFIIGRSLGTGVATYVATQRNVDALVLITPFDSITAIGQQRYPGLPVKLLIRHPFDSLSRAGMLLMPTMVIRAEQDNVVPNFHTDRLLKHLPNVKKQVTLKGTNHGNIVTSDEFIPLLESFLAAH